MSREKVRGDAATRWRVLSLIESVVATAAIGAVLFAAAGTTSWAGAWAWLILMLAGGVIMTFLLDPELLKERITAPARRRLRTWDAIWALTLGALLIGWLLVMARDAVSSGGSALPSWVRAVGAVAVVATYVISFLAFQANVFASPVVQLQAERHQTVATGGPYGVVRHPLYAGVLPFWPGTAMLLGSLYGLALSPALMAMVVVRTALEDRVLRAELDGYTAYAERVHYRLVPHVW